MSCLTLRFVRGLPLLVVFLVACQDSEKPHPMGDHSKNLAHHPQMAFEKATIALGDIDEAGVVRSLFPFTVKPGLPVEIKSIDASCGCMEAGLFVEGIPWSGKPLLPGTTGSLFIDLNTAEVRGLREATANVLLGDGALLQCKVVALVKPKRETSPSILAFGEVYASGLSASTIAVTFRSKKRFGISDQAIEIGSNICHVVSAGECKNIEGEWIQEVEFSLTPRPGSGKFRGKLTIVDDVQDAWVIWANGVVSDGLRTSPQSLINLGVCEQDVGGSTALELSLQDGAKNIEWSCEATVFSVVEAPTLEDGIDMKLNIAISRGTEKGKHTGSLRLSYDWAGSKVIKSLPIKAYVR